MVFIILFAIGFFALAVTGFVLGGMKLYKANNLSDGGWRTNDEDKVKIRAEKSSLRKRSITGFVIAIIGIVGFVLVPWNFHQVETGEVAVVRNMGKIEGTRDSGVHFDFWMTNSYQTYDTKIRSLSIETQAYSQDAQTMTIQMSVHYQIDPSKAVEIASKYGSLEILENRITGKAIQETKDVLTKRGAEKIIEERNLISQEVADAVESAIGADYYVDIQTVALTNIDFSDAFEKAVEEKMVAAQKKLQAEIENDMKIAAAKAEADAKLEEAKLKVDIATQEAEAAKIKASNEAEIKEIQANAEAEARKIVSEVWKNMSDEAREATLKQLALEKWDGKLPETMVGDDFLNDLIGALQAKNTNP